MPRTIVPEPEWTDRNSHPNVSAAINQLVIIMSMEMRMNGIYYYDRDTRPVFTLCNCHLLICNVSYENEWQIVSRVVSSGMSHSVSNWIDDRPRWAVNRLDGWLHPKNKWPIDWEWRVIAYTFDHWQFVLTCHSLLSVAICSRSRRPIGHLCSVDICRCCCWCSLACWWPGTSQLACPLTR